MPINLGGCAHEWNFLPSFLPDGLQLRSGRWVSSLVYADDVALLSHTSQGLQQLIDAMLDFCTSMGLTISPTKTEVVVLSAPPSDSSPAPQWHVASLLFLQISGLDFP